MTISTVETPGQKQRRFTLRIAEFVIAVYKLSDMEDENGKRFKYELSEGESYRSDEQAEINAMGKTGRMVLVEYLTPEFPELARRIKNNAGSGIRNSLHEMRLAKDFNLFVDGKWISMGDSPHWARLGALWESMGDDHRWGGRWGDANHFSIEHLGIK
jgi:hypothetical protein